MYIRDQKSDTVVVFVHGIESNNVDAWMTLMPPCSYWPDLLAADATYFKNVDIFLAGYYSKLDSGTYSVKDAASQLYTTLSTVVAGHDFAPLHHKNILFLAHSLGGIVVRQTLLSHSDDFNGHRLGLVLLGSPSKGSDYAKLIGNWFGDYYKNTFLDELKTNAPTLATLDAKFLVWLSERSSTGQPVAVAELFETTFPAKSKCPSVIPSFLCSWYATQLPEIVPESAAGGYDEEPRRIGNTDHLTLVKPTQTDGGVHGAVRSFFSRRFASPPVLYKEDYGTVSVSGEERGLAWEPYGSPSEIVFTAQFPCKQVGDEDSCGPWNRLLGGGFNATQPQLNDTGFVVIDDRIEPKPTSFVFSTAYIPDSSAVTYMGRKVRSSISSAVTYTGQSGESSWAVRTVKVQPVIYRTQSVLRETRLSVPPKLDAEIELDIPSLQQDVKVVISTFAGYWSIPLANVAAGQRYGFLNVMTVDRRADVTKLLLKVWPR
jgi:hypothetical protein